MIARSKKWKVLLHIFLMLLSVLIIVCTAAPEPLSPMGIFRQKERQALRGPAKIIDRFDFSNHREHIILGQSDYCYSVLTWQHNDLGRASLFYYPKDSSITAFYPGYGYGTWYLEDFEFPLIVFTEHENAVTATLTLELTWEPGTEAEVFEVETQLRPNGYFLFLLTEADIRWEALEQIQARIVNRPSSASMLTGYVTLFDQQGQEIESKILYYET